MFDRINKKKYIKNIIFFFKSICYLLLYVRTYIKIYTFQLIKELNKKI